MARKSFRDKLFLYYSLLFIAFAVITLAYQFYREKDYKTKSLNNTLDEIAEITNRFIILNRLNVTDSLAKVDSLVSLFPQNDLRITVILNDGTVKYDNFIMSWDLMDNHLSRPEVKEARLYGTGSAVRKSESTGITHYYYAKRYNNHIVRAALIYDIGTIKLLKVGAGYIIAIAVLFVLVWAFLLIITDKFSQSITLLRDFTIETSRNAQFRPGYKFPDNELGTIGSEITQMYNNLLKTRDELSVAKEKLFNHLNVLNEGVAFFSRDMSLILANQHFSQFLNLIADDTGLTAGDLFSINQFEPVKSFVLKEISENRIPFEVPVWNTRSFQGPGISG